MSTNSIDGRCLCGEIAFQLETPLGPMSHCHCQSCRLSRGAAFVTWTSVPAERFAVRRGEISWYRSSPGVRWGFCGNCGSSMLYIADEDGHPDAPRLGHVYVSVASLVGPITQTAVSHVSYEERVPWYQPTDALPKFRGKTNKRIA